MLKENLTNRKKSQFKIMKQKALKKINFCFILFIYIFGNCKCSNGSNNSKNEIRLQL